MTTTECQSYWVRNTRRTKVQPASSFTVHVNGTSLFLNTCITCTHSDGLQHMCLYKYYDIVNIKQKSTETTRGLTGWVANATFPFHPNHPLHETHHQQLHPNMPMPILAGKPPPRAVGLRRNTTWWLQEAQLYARYYVSLLVPWLTDLLFLPSYLVTYDSMCA